MKYAFGLAALIVAGSASAAPTLGPAYGEGMVLQRGEPILVAGTATPEGTVTGSLGGDQVSAKADREGAFTLSFPARKASETPISLSLRDASGETKVDNLLIGDVYLCSGQSNMELPVTRALNTFTELRLAPDDGIRLFKVAQTTAPVPQDTLSEPGAWQPATRESVEEFSAACFFMGKQLRADHPDVPLGLIHSNWGGSAASAWLTPESVRVLYGEDTLEQLRVYERDPLAAAQAFVPQWYDWWRANDNGREPWTDSSMLDWQPIPQFSFWNDWEGTGLDENPRANVWLRQTFTLTAEQASGEGALSIGAIDDLDLTWVNGNPVGYTFGWAVERTYRVPAQYLREGENEVLIAANNMWDTGGFFAGPERLFFTTHGGSTIPLGADWEYSIGTVEGVPPRAPWDANAGLGVMHNAMIAPLGPMRLAGVAWYQGEADVGQPDYDVKLRELFAGWRRQFGPQTRMLVVQLADYGQRHSEPTESAWAQVRQDQLDGVAADGNAALVTAIDIGEPTDIHPANKNDLGKRLAAAAQGTPMPMPAGATREGDRIVVRFEGVEGDLRAFGGAAPLGIEACSPDGTCRWADARIEGATVAIPVESGRTVARVRHAWSDAPIVNLYDARGLPIPGFELEVSP
ncbi:sialate O-acetylesterase [Alteriqipengyuania lutimaris]|uniref:Sialate O-acetylesterase n=1 Tax=Alteriqipengyuania lutimaris TaxID=1538146 RepID=A0A395LRX5_9SPHN|nr:sialate O-acetylesterase [Alteriqipengyuania lutimaris]MBB3033670.1 sialate O-acetylesterase [Alteriqipengyuania lutimaris]RDS77340.1 sialate O-acetylesterase [Alteriqipengyuania lutimaris]